MLKKGQTVIIDRDVAQHLIGVRGKIRAISPIGTLTIELLEDGRQGSCWKTGNIMHLHPYNVKEVSEHESVHTGREPGTGGTGTQ